MRALPLLVALLLVATAGVGSVPATVSSPADGPSDPAAAPQVDAADRPTDRVAHTNATNQSNRSIHVLTIPADLTTRSSDREHRVDLGPAIGLETNASDARLRTLAIVERVRAADNADGREREIRAAVRGIEQRTTALRQRERAAIDAYGADEIAPRTLLLRLARIDIAARELEHRRTVLSELARETDGFELDQRRLASLERRIDALTGPVRQHGVAVLQGAAPPSRFYVETGPDSVVLTTIRGDAYIREAFRGDRYTEGEENIDPRTALNITARSYPLVWETRQNNTEVTGSNGNYLVRIPHERGLLRAFVDGGSRSVYKEFQRRSLTTAAGDDNTSTVKDGLRLTVNRTYPGGPLRIGLHDIETGDPVDANITLGQSDRESELLGRTGSDGVLWTLSPRGQYTITAIRGNSAVVLTLRPAPPPRIGGS